MQGQSYPAHCLSGCERSLANSFLLKICDLLFPQGDYQDGAVEAVLSFLCCDLQILLVPGQPLLRGKGAQRLLRWHGAQGVRQRGKVARRHTSSAWEPPR